MQANQIALIIAASEYDDMRLQRLRSPASDANSLEEVLRDRQIGDYKVASLLNRPAYHATEAIAGPGCQRAQQEQSTMVKAISPQLSLLMPGAGAT